MYVSYIIVDDKLLLRQPQKQQPQKIEPAKIDKNDIENIIFQNINKIKLNSIENEKYLTASTSGAQWTEIQTESDTCNVYSSSINKLISLNNIQSTHIKIYINEAITSNYTYRVKGFTNKKKGEGTITIVANNIQASVSVQVLFLDGFLFEIDSDFTLENGNEEIKFWYNHISEGYTLLKNY